MAQKNLNRIISFAIMAVVLTALFALTAFAEISGGFGEIVGLEEGKTYTATPVTINTTGDGIAYVDADKDGNADVIDLATENKKLAGLYEVTEEGKDPVIVYVYGKLSERDSIGETTIITTDKGVEKLKPVLTKGTDWTPGVWITSNVNTQNYTPDYAGANKDVKYYTLAHIYMTDGGESAAKLYALTTAYDVVKKKMDATEFKNKKIQELYDTNYNYTDEQVPRVDEAGNPVLDDGEPLLDEETGEPVIDEETGLPAIVPGSQKQIIDVVRKYTTLNEAGETLLNTIKTTFEKSFEGWNFKYAYAPKEIIPVNELVKFPVYLYKGMQYVRPTSAKMKVIFYVLKPDGTIDSNAVWTSENLNKVGNPFVNTTIDVQSLAGLPEDGWVVGVEIKPFAEVDGSTFEALASNKFYTTQAYYCFYWENYKTECSVTYPAPKGLSFDGKKITGLKTHEEYVFAPVLITGIDKERAIKVSGVTEYTVPEGTVGLWGMYYDVDTDVDILGYLVYFYGKISDRKALGSLDGSNYPVFAYDTSKTWIPGTFLKARAWASSSFRANDIYGLTYSSGQLTKAIASEDPEDEVKIRTKVRDDMRKVNLRYAYETDEIIPIADVKTMKFAAATQNVYIHALNAKPKVELFIMKQNGEVEVVETIINSTWSYDSNSQSFKDSTIKTLDVQSIPNLPKEGWLVAYRYTPIYDVELTNIVPNTSTAANFDTRTTFGIYLRGPSSFASHASYYDITGPKKSKPTGITINGVVVNGLDAAKSYVIAPYSINGAITAKAKTVTGVTTVDLATLYSGETIVGLYGISILGDEYYFNTDPAFVYVYGSAAARAALGEVRAAPDYTSELGYLKTKRTNGFEQGFFTGDWNWGYYSGWGKDGFSSHEYHVPMDMVKAFVDASKTDKPTEFAKIQTRLQNITVKYAFTNEEITPISLVNDYNFKFGQNAGDMKYSGLVMKFVAHIMDENGNVNDYAYLTSSYNYQSGSYQSVKVEFNKDEVWDKPIPDSGYLVGFTLDPFYGFTDWNKFTGTGTANNRFTFTNGAFNLDLPMYETLVDVKFNGTTFSNLDADKTYAIARFAVNGIEKGENDANVETVTGVTEADITALFKNPVGLYGIYRKGDAEFSDSPAVLGYIKGDYEKRAALLELYDYNYTDSNGKPQTVECITISQTSDFVLGNVTYPYSFYNRRSANMDIEGQAYGVLPDSNFGWGKSDNPGLMRKFYYATDKEAAFKEIQTSAKKSIFKYAFTFEEIVPVSDVFLYTFSIDNSPVYSGACDFVYKNNTVAFDAYIATVDGKVESYRYLFKNTQYDTTERKYAVDFKNGEWEKNAPPADGYLVGFAVHPFYGFDNYEDLTVTPNFNNTNLENERSRVAFRHYYNEYVLIEDVIPVIEKSEFSAYNTNFFTNTFNVKNYKNFVSYKYSYGSETEAGTTWFDLTNSKIEAAEPGKYVWVKPLIAENTYGEPQRSDKHSEYVTATGVCLRLDGAIELKIEFKYDPEKVKDVYLSTTPKNNVNDANYNTSAIKVEEAEYDSANGTGFIIIKVLPKDVSALWIENQLLYTKIGETQHVNTYSLPGKLSVYNIVNTYKKLAALEGEDAYDRVLPLIEALETYYTYTAKYFDNTVETVDEITLTAEEQLFVNNSTPAREGKVSGLEFHSSSLILESSTTLRHYFVIDDITSLSKYTAKLGDTTLTFKEANVEDGANNTYVYVDVANIPAHKLDEQQTVVVTDGTDTLTINFSAVDYAKISQNDTNAKLRNLAKAVAKYAYEANKYVK